VVKSAEWRRRKYEAGVNPDVIGKRFGQVKPGMVRQESTYFPQIALVEAEVKRIVEAAGIPSYEVAQYVNVGRVCYSIAKRFSQATRDLEAQRVVNHWAARGLDGPLLAQACRAGGCEVVEPSAVCYNPCAHASDKHDATVLDTIVKWIAANIGKVSLDDLLGKWKVIIIPTNAGHSTSHAGSGGATSSLFYIIVSTGTTANSRGLVYAYVYALNSGDRARLAIDYSKGLEWEFSVTRDNSDAQSVARVQLKQVSTEGALADVGLGLEINNYAVLGEAYGTARQTVSLGTLTEDRSWHVKIVLVPGVRVDFWVNGVLTGTLTGTAVPTGVLVSSFVVYSIVNGAAGGVNAYMSMGNIKIIQEW